MLLSLNWISEFIKINKSAKEIADKITLSLSEVEKIEKLNNDWILEIENKALTHRPDCFSQLGLAREISAFFNIKLKDPLKELNGIEIIKPEKELPFTVSVSSSINVPRYLTIVLDNIKVDKSPDFIQRRLLNCGVRPINNVVDITNYVMLELGQPTHAYDYHKVDGHKITVRKARTGEVITTINGINYNLDDTMVVIADKTKPLLLGGIMGGKDSEVSENTNAIILEAAVFDPSLTRKTSKKTGLRTEASTRYEKNLDPHFAKAGLIRTIELLKKYAKARIASNLFDIHKDLPEKIIIKSSAEYINSLLGLDLSNQNIKNLLERLKLTVSFKNNDIFIEIPEFRKDLTIEADIAEEVARIYGYDNIPTTLPQGLIQPPPINKSLEFERQTKYFFKGLGFSESHLPSFIGEKDIKLIGESVNSYLKLINPIAPEKTFLRKSLLPGLFLAAKNNLRFFNNFSLYEIGRVFNKNKEGLLPDEKKLISAVLVSKSYLEAKGIIEALFDYFKLEFPEVEPVKNGLIYNINRGADIPKFGSFGEINATILSFLQSDLTIASFELDFDLLTQKGQTQSFYNPIPQYPAIIEDFSFTFKDTVMVGQVIKTIKNVSGLISSVELIDQFEQTLTFKVSFQNPKSQLAGKDVFPLRKRIASTMKKEFNAEVKGAL